MLHTTFKKFSVRLIDSFFLVKRRIMCLLMISLIPLSFLPILSILFFFMMSTDFLCLLRPVASYTAQNFPVDFFFLP